MGSMVKHGNWNAYQKTEAELHAEETERRASKVGSVCRVARQMFEIVSSAEDLNADGRAAAVEMLAILMRRLGEK